MCPYCKSDRHTFAVTREELRECRDLLRIENEKMRQAIEDLPSVNAAGAASMEHTLRYEFWVKARKAAGLEE